MKVCRQNKGYWREEFECRRDPRGRDYYWLTGVFLNQEAHATDTDEYALACGYVSIVPMQIDLTDYARLTPLERVFGGAS
jgi:5'-nucleotidase